MRIEKSLGTRDNACMGWIIRIVTLFASWMKLKSSVEQTKEGVRQASSMASGFQQKHTQDSLEKAMTGDPAALYDLGERHYDGRGVPLDYQKAAGWFAKAADAGHVKALTNLGLMSLVGRGLPKDRRKAIQFLEAAAQKGDAAAKETLQKIKRKKT